MKEFELSYKHVLAIGFLLIVICYYPSLNAPFYFDDYSSIVNNPDLGDFYSSLFSTIGGIRPLSYVTFHLNLLIWGEDPYWFRIINICIHLINTFLIFKLGSVLLKKTDVKEIDYKMIATIVAIIWSLHPIQANTVSYIVQRMTLLSTTFTLMTLLEYFRYTETFSKSSLVKALFYFIVSLGFKESGIFVVLVLAAYEITVGSRKRGFYFIGFIAFIAVAMVALDIYGFRQVFTSEFYTVRSQAKGFSLFEKLLAAPAIWMEYIKVILLPFFSAIHLYFHSLPKPILFNVQGIADVVFFLISFSSAFFFYRQKTLSGFLILSFLILFVPEHSIFHLDFGYFHRLYFSLFFLILFLGILMTKIRNKKVPVFICLFLTFFYCVNLSTRNKVFSDPEWFYSNELTHSTDNIKIHNNFGAFLLSSGKPDEALQILEEGYLLNSDNYEINMNLGMAQAQTGKYDKAISSLQRADKPGNHARDTLYFNLSVVYLLKNNIKQSLSYYYKVKAMNPNYPGLNILMNKITSKKNENLMQFN